MAAIRHLIVDPRSALHALSVGQAPQGSTASSVSDPDYRLTLEQKAALHALAVSQIRGEDYRLTLALLVGVVFQDAPPEIREEMSYLISHRVPSLKPYRLAWLVALTGDHHLFESLSLEPEPEEAAVFVQRGHEVPIRWRLGMEGLMRAFGSLMTHPAFSEALDFLYPRYYDGPLYFLIPDLIDAPASDNRLRWLAKAVNDAAQSRELLLHPREDEEEGDILAPDDKEAIIADAISDASTNSDLQVLDLLLPIVPGGDAVAYAMHGRNGKDYALVELLLKHHPETVPAILQRLGLGEQPQLELVLSRLGPQHASEERDIVALRAAFYGLVRQNLFSHALELADRLGPRAQILKGVTSRPPSVQQLEAFRELAWRQGRADLAALIS